jgi:hypothetical protein
MSSMALTRVERVTCLSVRDAPLPDNFKRMLDAIDDCLRVDECKEWANQATAAASYWRQKTDCERYVHKFERLATRAKLRCREILNAIEDDARREESRLAAGIRLREYTQLGNALKVPRLKREALIERTPPARVSTLARIGNPPAVYVPQPGTGSAPGFAAVLAFYKVASMKNAADEAAKIDPQDAPYIAKMLRAIEDWAAEFERGLPKFKVLKASRRG